MINWQLMTKSTLETTQPCPTCSSPVATHLDFCHRCGETVAKIFIRQTRRPSIIFAAAGILAACFAIIVVMTIADFVHQYGVPGGGDVKERVECYVAKGQTDSAIILLEESLKEKSQDQRAPEWQQLLDQTLYGQGKKLGAEGKFRDAVTSLARISSGFDRHEEVDKLIAEYSDKGLKAVFGKQEEGDTGEHEVKSLTRMEKAVMTAVPGGPKRTGLPTSHL
jgi:hypothetical protein